MVWILYWVLSTYIFLLVNSAHNFCRGLRYDVYRHLPTYMVTLQIFLWCKDTHLVQGKTAKFFVKWGQWTKMFWWRNHGVIQFHNLHEISSENVKDIQLHVWRSLLDKRKRVTDQPPYDWLTPDSRCKWWYLHARIW